ncbi:TIR domain-containing protein [Lentzea alba]|uniref:NACHT N-terminal helical domain 7-containing protein n=1 Tax=Lentzea alba TaxID=2714351 RepID=UPI0039BEF4A3
MPPATTTLRGALLHLGKDDPAWLETVDSVLGRALTGTSIQQSKRGLFGWLTGGALAVVQDAMSRTVRQLPDSYGQSRRDTVSALHTALVATAFFESVCSTLRGVRDLALPVGHEWDQEDHSLVSYLYSDDLPTPSATRGFDELRRWASHRGERVHRAVQRSNPACGSEALLTRGFARGVLDRYEAGYETYAADIPEFELWSGGSAEVLEHGLAPITPEVPEDNPRATLFQANLKAAGEPVLGEPGFPAIHNVYIAPRFRMTEADARTRLADESWWAGIEPRGALHTLLIGHLTSAEAFRTPLLMIGAPGVGKTTMITTMAVGLPGFTSVRVPLRGVDRDAPIVDQIDEALRRQTGDQVTWLDLFRQSTEQTGVVMLDELDELAPGRHRNYLDEVVRFQQSEAAQGRPVAVVVTARTGLLDQVLVPDGTLTINLAEFDDEQVREWAKKWPLAVPVGTARNPLQLSMSSLPFTNPDFSMLAVAAFGMLNRGWRALTEDELRDDLAAAGFEDLDVVPAVLRDMENRPTSFIEHVIADFVLRELIGGQKDLVLDLLSRRPLALRPPVLTFVAQLAAQLDDDKRTGLTYVLKALLDRYRRRTGPSLSAYTANLVLLQLFVQPADQRTFVAPEVSNNLILLWRTRLDAGTFHAIRSMVAFKDKGFTRRQEHTAEPVAELDSDAPAGVEVLREWVPGPHEIREVYWSAGSELQIITTDGDGSCWRLEEDPEFVSEYAGVADTAWHPKRSIAAIVQAEPGLGGDHELLVSDFRAEPLRLPWAEDSGALVCWSPDGKRLGVYRDSTLSIYDTDAGHWQDIVKARRSRAEDVRTLQWSGQYICTTSAHTVSVFDMAADPVSGPTRHSTFNNELLDVSITADERGLIATRPKSQTSIEVWHLIDAGAPTTLEGHTKPVVCARFSPDGDYLVSMSLDDTVRIWRQRDWQCVALLRRENVHDRGTVAFHPTKPLLALANGNRVDIVRLDRGTIGTIGAAAESRRYANAKIVLVGDSGVGKSGLGLVLSGRPFEPTESTHGRNVWTFEKSIATTESGETQTRETLLWDLAGQPGYRMVHQLHLNEVAVALVVFDARSETDPFAGVQYWSRALNQARRLDGAAAVRLKAYLVAARADRGGTAVSTARVQQAVEAHGFDGYIETSAKEGWGVGELVRTVRDAIDWDAVPKVSSTALFQSIKDFVVEEKKQGRILTTVDDLLHSFRRVQGNEEPAEELTDGFEACLGRLESVGVIRRMAFGDYVLLRPELLDSYASSLVQTAKDEPDGLGFVPEKDALEGSFRMPESERLTNRQQERVLLISVVEELLRREIALKEVTDREVDLIFPSQFTRERPDAPQPPGQDVVFTFDGDLHTIYSTLAVRLSHSRLFQREAMWHNSASYKAEADGTCGIAIREIEEGKGELTLCYDEQAQPITRHQFEAYVVEHLHQRAVAVELRRIRRCKPCDYAVADEVVQRRLERGLTTVICQLCDRQIPIVDQQEPTDVRPAVAEMNSNANAQRDQDVAATTLKGKRETEDYDVFLCHNVKDKPQVLKIAKKLEERGILPWLDVDSLQPGTRWHYAMAEGIEKSRSAAVLVGPAGFGPWHDTEMQLISDWSVRDNRRRVIPVILEGTAQDPVLPGFLRVWSTVDMRTADPDPIEQLIWGITDRHPRRD